MFDPSSFANPTPLAHADTSRDVLPKGGTSQWRPTRGNYQNSRQGNQRFESRNTFQNDDRRFNDRGYQFRNRCQNDDFSRGDQRNRSSSENFSRDGRKQMGRLNALKVKDIKDFIGGSKIILDFDRKALAIPESQINKVVKTVEIEIVEIDLSKTKLDEKQKRELQDLFDSFQGLFSDKPGLTHVLYHEIDTGDNPPVVSWPYRYDSAKQKILDYRTDKMLKEGTKIPIQSPYASPVVLYRKNNGLHHRIIRIMSALDLRSGYFKLAVSPCDIVKTAFVTKNGTYAFRRMPFSVSEVDPNFQKAIDIILKPVIRKFVNIYMDDVIIASPSFTQHVKHLKEVFRLLHEAGLTLNKDKCKNFVVKS
ncbi:retrovirus-related Pol polyprotein from transposon 17.6 [Trichonephila clavipes]|nr:retrovirus-related Pol polyprotein from transposon 17.6 [Trichonephila clavipes]